MLQTVSAMFINTVSYADSFLKFDVDAACLYIAMISCRVQILFFEVHKVIFV